MPSEVHDIHVGINNKYILKSTHFDVFYSVMLNDLLLIFEKSIPTPSTEATCQYYGDRDCAEADAKTEYYRRQGRVLCRPPR